MNFMMHQTGAADGVRDDYEQRFPPDDPGAECGPRARVWRVYNEEAKEYDLWMVTNLRENLDVLLVFAALFSAVMTTFVAQTSQSLQPDYGLQSSLLLAEMVHLQRAAISGSGPESVPITSMEALNPSPSGGDLWVNGLWFASLTLSLTTALLAALARQWVHYYVTAGHSGAPRDMCRLRHFRLMGIEQWRVPVIVGFLPFCLHLSLAIFLAGLIVFLWDLSRTLAYMVGVLTSVAYVSYIGSIGLSMIFPNCPYRTGLSNIVSLFLRNLDALVSPVKTLFVRKDRIVENDPARVVSHLSVSQREKDAIQRMGCELDARMLRWLLETSSNSSVRAVVIQAIAGLPAKLDHSFLQSMFPASFGLEQDYKFLLDACSEYTWGEGVHLKKDCINKVEQLVRFKRRRFLRGETVAPVQLPSEDAPIKWAFTSTRIISSFLPGSSEYPSGSLDNLYNVIHFCSQSLEMWHELFKTVLQRAEVTDLVDISPHFFWHLGNMAGKRHSWIEDEERIASDDIEQAISFQTALLYQVKGDGPNLYDFLRDNLIDAFCSFIDADLRTRSPGIALILGLVRYALQMDTLPPESEVIHLALFAIREVSFNAKLSHIDSHAIFRMVDTIFESGILCNPSTPLRGEVSYETLYIASFFYSNRTPRLRFAKHKTYWRMRGTWLLEGMKATLKTLPVDDLNFNRGQVVSKPLVALLFATHRLIELVAAYWVLDEPGTNALVEEFVAIDGLGLAFRYKFALPWFELMHAFVSYVAKLKDRDANHAETLETYLSSTQNHFSVTLCLIGTFGHQDGIRRTEADIRSACTALIRLRPQAETWNSTLGRLDDFIRRQDELTTDDHLLDPGSDFQMINYEESAIVKIKEEMQSRMKFLKEQLSECELSLSKSVGHSPDWLGPHSSWVGDRGPGAIQASIPPSSVEQDSTSSALIASPDSMNEKHNVLLRIKREWKRRGTPFSNHGESV